MPEDNDARGKRVLELIGIVRIFAPLVAGAFVIGAIYFSFKQNVEQSQELIRGRIPAIEENIKKHDIEIAVLKNSFDEHCKTQEKQFTTIEGYFKVLMQRERPR